MTIKIDPSFPFLWIVRFWKRKIESIKVDIIIPGVEFVWCLFFLIAEQECIINCRNAEGVVRSESRPEPESNPSLLG